MTDLTLIQERRANHGAFLYSQEQVLVMKTKLSNSVHIVVSGFWRTEAEYNHRNLPRSGRKEGI